MCEVSVERKRFKSEVPTICVRSCLTLIARGKTVDWIRSTQIQYRSECRGDGLSGVIWQESLDKHEARRLYFGP